MTREVFRAAIKRNASNVIVAHNRPSGNAEPSVDDQEVTHKLKKAGDILGITLLDHVILAGGSFVSLRERGIVS